MSYLLQIVETEEQPVLSVKTTTSVSNMPNVVGRIYGLNSYCNLLGAQCPFCKVSPTVRTSFPSF